MAFDTDIFGGCDGLFICMASWANQVTEHAFWFLLLLGFVFVMFMVTYPYQSNRAFAFAGTTGIFGALMMVTLGLIPWWIATIFFVSGIIGIIVMVMGDN